MANVRNSNEKHVAGVIGFFDTPHALIEAATRVRDARFQNFDCFTPYPVHGLEAAAGLKRSPIPFVTFAAGLTGTCIAFLFQYWTSAVDWPLIVGGKPFNSWPAFVPVMFELTVLFAGLCTVGAMFAFCGLPNVRRRIYDPGLTRDKLALVIEASPIEDEIDDFEAARRSRSQMPQHRKFEEGDATQFLKQLGAHDVRTVYTEEWF